MCFKPFFFAFIGIKQLTKKRKVIGILLIVFVFPIAYLMIAIPNLMQIITAISSYTIILLFLSVIEIIQTIEWKFLKNQENWINVTNLIITISLWLVFIVILFVGLGIFG